MDSRTNRAGTHSYSHIWILTLKRIYAEGLQQIIDGRGKGGAEPMVALREFGGKGERLITATNNKQQGERGSPKAN